MEEKLRNDFQDLHMTLAIENGEKGEFVFETLKFNF